ncbi:hypothetical protein I302_108503 [Kwoniella bestiolae CBS 10118]|uniref:Uncharacterized protein n=1 Tax=Kwoniella bestiolae CBS 10118 TaxID=1296100 RepID=A0A1B9FVI7_9TREE|nr:hypothetical protein I302_07121 [Kwoniella bestiolae CBS 10118]OCF22780.1 hypothetical protein I302_07121 [Kwoniella bestiolae CBS 10118]
MPSFFSLPYILGSLVVLGVAQACYYYVYLESPYDYYYRYCNVGCAGMDQNDENFNQCCLPMTSGQTAPAVCQTLSASCAAAGTTCTWGSAVPTSDQPSTSAPPATYTPPAYTPQPRDAAPTTETVWVTETSTTPCATTEQASAPTSTTPEECVCEEEEGETSEAPKPTAQTPKEGELAPEGYPDDSNSRRRRRRGIKIRDTCVCPTSSAAPAPTTPPAPTTENAATPITTSAAEEEDECVCPPEGETGEAGTSAHETPKEGELPQSNVPLNGKRRRGIRARGGECICPPKSSAPPAPPAPTECVCPPEGTTSQASKPTAQTPKEGSGPSDDFVPPPGEGRRGIFARNGDCVCPTTGNAAVPATPAPPPPEEPCECPPEGTTSQAGTPTAATPREGELPTPGYQGNDADRRRGIMVRNHCVCPTSSETLKPTAQTPKEGSGPTVSVPEEERRRNIPTAPYPDEAKRSLTPGENWKYPRNSNPVQTVTSTTTVTTDDCAHQTAPPAETTGNAAAPTTSETPTPSPTAKTPAEGSSAPEGFPGDARKRKFRRWSDF